MLGRLIRRLRALARRGEMDRELDEELRYHLEREVEQNLRGGMSPEEARYAALRSFGGVEQAKERCREARGVRLIEDFWQDLRYGTRSLYKDRGFTLVAVVTLALGIGANTAIFSVVNSVVLRPLPFHDPERLMLVGEVNPRGNSPSPLFSPANFLDFERGQRSFEAVGAFTGASVKYYSADEVEDWGGATVTDGFFRALGVAPLLGRTFTRDDTRGGSPPAVILSHRLWQRRFGGDPAIVGRQLTIDRQPRTVIGVMPARFRHPLATDTAEVWTPLATDTSQFENRSDRYVWAVGRLKAGVTREQAQGEMNVIAARFAQDFAATNKGWGLQIVDLFESVAGEIRPVLFALLGAGCLVLAVAVANVCNLLLARASARRKELAVRAALGAGRARLVRQVLTEGALLALAGGALGALLAWSGVEAVRGLKPADLPRLDEVAMDWRVLLFLLLASIVAGCASGLLSGWLATRVELNEALKEGGRQAGGGVRHARARSLLIISELALALVLLAGAGLLVRSLYELSRVDPGFTAQNVLTGGVGVSMQKYPDSEQRGRFYELFVERVKRIPGVEQAGVTTAAPLTGYSISFPASIKGRPQAADERQRTPVDAVTPDYFRTLKIPLLAGREITPADRYETKGVAVVSASLARRHFGTYEAALGEQIEIIYLGRPVTREVVGVVGDIKRESIAEAFQPSIYVAATQLPWFSATLVVRTSSDPRRFTKPVQQALQEFDKDRFLFKPRTLEEAISESVAGPRFYSLLVGAFAAIAVTLAAVGLYGVISYLVSQRTHEIGVRIALGARRRDILRLVVGQGMWLVAAGLGLGVLGALAATRALSALLYGVSARDPLSFISVGALLAAVALLACYVPARRAAKVDPMIALRHE